MRPSPTKDIDILFDNAKRYFPGDTIRGRVILCPERTTRTETVCAYFVGHIILSTNGRTETLNLFEQTKHLRLPGDSNPIFELQANMTYTFPFTFIVPDDLGLPSELEYNNRASIRYIVAATHKHHRVPISCCPRAEFRVPVYEFINIESTTFCIPQRSLVRAVRHHANLSVSTTRKGYAIGATIPVKSTLFHPGHLGITQGLDVSLVRVIDIWRGSHNFLNEETIDRVRHTIHVRNNEPLIVTSYLHIPESAFPTIKYNGVTLQVHYQVRVLAKLDSRIRETTHVQLPIVVGTWPSNPAIMDFSSSADMNLLSDHESHTLFRANLRSNDLLGLSLSHRPRPISIGNILPAEHRQIQHNVGESNTHSIPPILIPSSPTSSVMSFGSDTSTLVGDFLTPSAIHVSHMSTPALHPLDSLTDEPISLVSPDSDNDDQSGRPQRIYDHGTYLIAL